MTATALKVKSTPMAPYIGLMRGMSRRDIQIVVTFLNEVMEEEKKSEAAPMTNAEIIREKYKNLRISPRIKWYKRNMADVPEWDSQEVWSQLTDEQRLQAERLNLSPEDMDARTYSILTKWIQ